MEEFVPARVPWSRQPSFKEVTDEVGLDFDILLESFEDDKSDEEIARELDVTEGLIYNLRDHFMRYGVGSVEGQD